MARVLLLGRLADVAGWRERQVAADSLAGLLALLAADDPALGEALAGPSVQTAVDKALVRGEAALTALSEVAFLPPHERRMSVTLQTAPFDPGRLLASFSAGREETGAIASFTGLARGERGRTTALELEAYEGFTDAAIATMVETAVHRFGLQDAMVVHRTGPIAPGEAIVFVATAAAHRRAAFEACDHLMDWLKSRAPFWKKEHGPDGARWIEPTDADRADAARWDKDRQQ